MSVLSIDQKIEKLSSKVDAEVRERFREALRALREGRNPRGAIVQASSLALVLIRFLFKAAGQKIGTNDSLFSCIERAQKMNFLSLEIGSYLHNPRLISNKADHADERISLTVADAEIALMQLMRFCEWFYIESEFGPELKTIDVYQSDGLTQSFGRKKQEVLILVTGGTIDSHFDGERDEVIVNDQSIVPNYLKNKIKPHFRFAFEVVTLRDSRDFSNETRGDILHRIKHAKQLKILVTHGTYTMPQTLDFLGERVGQFADKTVILTGSMLPLIGITESDAPFNLGFALANLQFLDTGVYLAMNGRIFNPGDVKKDVQHGRFELL